MRKRLTILLIYLLSTVAVANAQQTIISVPSSDVLPKGNIILKESNRLNPFDDNQSYQLTPTITVGTGWGTEVSIGAATTLKENIDTAVRLDIAAKKVFYFGEATRLTVGGRVTPYLTTGQDPDSFMFAHGTYKIKKTKTSLTSGVYFGGKNCAPNSFGFLAGIDQVIIPNKFRLVMDYMSRTDSFGALNVGFKYRPVPDLSITTAVSIPMQDNKHVGFIVSISKYLGDYKDVYAKMFKRKDQGDL